MGTEELYKDYNKNDVYDLAEPYGDSNINGKYDLGEPYEDLNNNGLWDKKERFVDKNENGKWTVLRYILIITEIINMIPPSIKRSDY